jgi:GNAT superfamily N-acetyltransferase
MFSIRTMTSADVDAVVTIIRSHEEADGELAERYYHEFFESEDPESPLQHNVVAIVDATAEVAGVGGWYPDKYDWPGILWLNWFYVAESHRRRGVGTMLLQHIIENVQRLDTRKLYVDTSTDAGYDDAVQLYERFGFREEGRLIDYYELGEDYLILGLDLTRPQIGPTTT